VKQSILSLYEKCFEQQFTGERRDIASILMQISSVQSKASKETIRGASGVRPDYWINGDFQQRASK
jgi:hypothetical protein